MKKLLLLCTFFTLPYLSFSQCTTLNATTCKCRDTTQTNCDLLPDITVSRNPLNNPSSYTEYAQVCSPPCNGNDGRLRLSVSTPNIGYGPMETRGTPTYVCGTDTFTASSVATIPATCPNTGLPPRQMLVQRIYHKNGTAMSFTDRPAGTMTFHPSHGHQHVDDWGEYTLRTATSDPNPLNWPVIGTGAKLAFCLLDIASCNSSPGYCVDSAGNNVNSTNHPNYGLGGGNYGCSNVVQGISAGYLDTYSQGLDGMWINLPPGLCNGSYWIVVEIDPNQNFIEEKEDNNVVAVPITLTKQSGSLPVITANGPTTFCAGGSVTLTSSPATDYLWSTGATTASIVVNQAGNYSVTINSASACPATSNPTTVTVTSLSVNANATPDSVCPGTNVQLQASVAGSGTTLGPIDFTNSNPVSIPDNNATGASSSVTVSGINPSTIGSTTIAKVKVNITHTYDGDIALSLISPSGNTMYLSNRRGGSGDNYINTVFVPSGASAISTGAAPFTGNYLPDGSFGSLTGNVNGTWTLKVVDLAGQDIGTINNWTLTINNTLPATYSYSWTSDPAGFTSSDSTPVANPTLSTIYTVTATQDGGGCSGSQTVNVSVGGSISISTNTPAPICSGQSTLLTASGAATYIWSPATGLSATTGSSVTASPNSTAVYQVIGNSSGCTDTAYVTVNVLPSPLLSPLLSQSICSSQSANLSTSGAQSYSWSPAAGLNATTGSSVVASPASTTLYTVTGMNANGCTATQSATITVNSIPAAPASVTGSSHNCLPLSNAAFSVAPVSGANSYNWTAPAGISISGQGNSNVNLSTTSVINSTLCVNASNQCGTSLNTCIPFTTQTSPPVTPGSVSGQQRVCPGETITYSVTPVTRAMFYNWQVPNGVTVNSGAGTNAINVTFNGSFTSSAITVTAGNGCGLSGVRTKNLTLNNPATPGAMTGPAYGVCGTAQTYSVPTVAGMNYAWTLPAGVTPVSGINSNSINVIFSSSFSSGVLSVRASNLCGTSNARSKTVRGTTAQPASVNGPNSVCTGQTNVTYSTAPLAGAVTYLWTVPSNCIITSGQGSTSITVTMSGTPKNGSVSVRGVNSCGNGSARSLAISINNCPKFAAQFNKDESIAVYPNPANEYVEVIYNTASTSEGTLKMMDILGKVKYVQTINAAEGRNSYMIDLKKYAPGIYIMSIEQGDNKHTQRLVVN